MIRAAGQPLEKPVQYQLAADLSYGSAMGFTMSKSAQLNSERYSESDSPRSVSGTPFIDLGQIDIDPDAIRLVPGLLSQRHRILPVRATAREIIIAVADPLNFQALEDVQLATGMEVIPVLADQAEIDWAIRQYAGTSLDAGLDPVINELYRLSGEAASAADDVSESLDDAPVVRIIDLLINQAVVAGASDIHIEPQKDRILIRYRIDGLLRDMLSLRKQLGPLIISRLKIMSNLDIGEKRLPQDGRIHFAVEGAETHFRVSTIPTIEGEKVVLRLLNSMQTPLSVETLGFQGLNRQLFEELLRSTNGIILVTGPTGTGKTTTLYTILNCLSSRDRNIITIEDPVEYSLPGINQIQVGSRTGLTFANGLRSVLRQDPDIIMVGEIRDSETAQLAIQAALTGHLVLSTLHTNSAAGSVTRLVDMGIEPFLISSSLRGVIAQRLVRGICPNCMEEYVLGSYMARQTGLHYEEGNTFFHGRGCSSCMGSGYRGRLAIQEILIMTREVGRIILNSIGEEEIENAARENGMRSLFEDGLVKARAGLTSLEEVLKVIHLAG